MDRNQAATEIFNALIALCNREPAPRVQMRAQGRILVLHLLARHPDGDGGRGNSDHGCILRPGSVSFLANLERKDLDYPPTEPEDRRLPGSC